jgi:hypothetical protein
MHTSNLLKQILNTSNNKKSAPQPKCEPTAIITVTPIEKQVPAVRNQEKTRYGTIFEWYGTIFEWWGTIFEWWGTIFECWGTIFERSATIFEWSAMIPERSATIFERSATIPEWQ